MFRHRLLLILWLLSDLILFVSLYALAYFLRVGFILSSDFPLDQFLLAASIVSPVWLLVLLTTRTFGLTRKQWTVRNAAYITYAAAMGVALFSVTYYFIFEAFFSRLLLILAFLLTTVGTLLWHALFQWIQRGVLRRDPPAFPTLIIGATREATHLIKLLNKNCSPLKPVAVLDGRGTKETTIAGVPVRGRLHKLEEVLKEEKITHLIQCSDLEQSMNLLSACRVRGIHYMLLPSVLGIVERNERVDSLEGQPVTVVSPKGAGWEKFFV